MVLFDTKRLPGSISKRGRPNRGSPFKIGSLGLSLLSLIICLFGWYLLTTYRVDLGVVTFRNVPTPLAVAEAALKLVTGAKFLADLRASVFRVLVGFFGAAVVGVLLGLAIGRSRRAAALLLPPLELLRPIPAVAWIPLAVLMFPSAELSMISITFVGGVFPVIVATIHGVAGVEPRYVAAARSLGASTRAIFLEVILPAALPSIFTGLTIGMGTAWFCLITAEMISGQFGVGYFTWESYTLQNYDDIVVGMVIIGVLGTLCSAAVKWAGYQLSPWTRRGTR